MIPATYTAIASRLSPRRHRKTKAHAALQVWMNAQLERDVAANEFAAAEDTKASPPIRPMSVSGRAVLGSSGGSESCVLGRAENSKHGQPRWPDAHGPDASGNPAKLGAPIDRVEGPDISEAHP